MNAAVPDYYSFVVSKYPYEVTVGDLKLRLGQQGEDAKNYIVDFIYNRLNHRYVEPLMHIPCEKKSGFLMMASACLLIETLQSLYEGRNRTETGDGGPSFERFFSREEQYFPDFTDARVNFYSNIRCGILHQAETKGGYRILRDYSALLNIENRTIEANRFLAALKDCLDNYIKKLRASDCDPELWKLAKDKVDFICENC